jgi:DNA-binding transcriptional LysR family regulator
MELHQVRYFLAVCDTLNFPLATERCNVSQPALTRAVKKLEGELGGLLFRRERNLTHRTDHGRSSAIVVIDECIARRIHRELSWQRCTST